MLAYQKVPTGSCIPNFQAAVNIAKIIAQTKLHSLRLNRNPLGDGGANEFKPIQLGASRKQPPNLVGQTIRRLRSVFSCVPNISRDFPMGCSD